MKIRGVRDKESYKQLEVVRPFVFVFVFASHITTGNYLR